MSNKISGAVWDSDLERQAKFVALALADHADHAGGGVRPSLALVAWKTNYSEDQCRRIIHSLLEAGVLVLEKRGVGRGNPSHYRFDCSKLPQRPSWEEERERLKGGTDAAKGGTVQGFDEPENLANEGGKPCTQPAKGGTAMPPESFKPTKTKQLQQAAHGVVLPPAALQAIAGKWQSIHPLLDDTWLAEMLAGIPAATPDKDLAAIDKRSRDVVQRALAVPAGERGHVSSVAGFATGVYRREVLRLVQQQEKGNG